MSRLNGIQLIRREYRRDDRGWLLKVLTGREDHLSSAVGEFYLVMAEPGEVRGNHYHERTSEWFTVVLGRARLLVLDPTTGERGEYALDAVLPPAQRALRPLHNLFLYFPL